MSYHLTFDEQYCKGCELCVHFCPKKILTITEKFNQSGYPIAKCIDDTSCIGCMMCVKMCPDSVIGITHD